MKYNFLLLKGRCRIDYLKCREGLAIKYKKSKNQKSKIKKLNKIQIKNVSHAFGNLLII